MGLPGLRRADTAGRTSGFLSLCCLILALAAPAPGAAVADDDDATEPATTPVPAADADADLPDAPVRSVGEVTVTATRAERDVLEVPGNVTVIEREEIERSGARSVPELLRRQSGLLVTTTTSNPAGVQVEARGFNNGGALGSSLLVQVDGRRVNQADTGNTDWATIPLGSIESIEIVRGPASALYGDNAVGGVINIRTLPAQRPLRATMRGKIGRYHSGEASLDAAGTVGPVTGSILVEGLRTDGYRKGADFDREDVKGSLAVELGERVVVGVQGGWYHDQRDLPGALDKDEIRDFGRRARQPGMPFNGVDVESRFVEGRVEAVPVDGLEFSLRPYYRWRDDDALVTWHYLCDIFDPTSGVDSDYATDTSQDSVGVGGQAQLDLPVFEHRNRLIVGFDFLHEEVDRTVVSSDTCVGISTTLSDLERNVYAGFVQDEFNLLENLILSAGVRFDHADLDLAVSNAGVSEDDDPDFSVWSPKAALTWRILPTVSAYFSYSHGFRLPNFDEDVPVLPSPWTPLKIPDLAKQTSKAFEIGAKWRDERVDASLALYHMKVKNEIFLNPDPSAYENQNFDRVRHRGIEASIHYWILDWLAAYASYTLEDVEIRKAEDPAFGGRRVPITPLHRGTAGIFARFPYWLELTLHANIVGQRKVANDFFGVVDSLDRYGTLDLLAAWRPEIGEHLSGALTVALRNVTDKDYEGFGAKSAFSDRVVFNPAAKRTWEVGLTFTVRQ
jgi:outer membrane receptor protein involved in Fe transport